MKADQEALINALRDKFPNGSPTCILCHSQISWDTTIFELREYNKGTLVVGGDNSSLVPIIIATCQNCGHVYIFNAIKMGLIDPKTGDLKKEA